MTSLEAVATYLPQQRVAIEELAGQLGLDRMQVRLLRRFQGFSEIRLDSGGSLADLLTAAVTRLGALRGQQHRVKYVLHAAAGKAGLTLSDISLILPHNVNVASWRRLGRATGFPPDRILLDNVPVTGHAFGADAFINYQTALQRGLLRRGEAYLLAAAGLGATYSAMVFEHCATESTEREP